MCIRDRNNSCTVILFLILETSIFFSEISSFDMMVLIVQIEEISEKNIDVSSMRNNMTVQELFTLINR